MDMNDQPARSRAEPMAEAAIAAEGFEEEQAVQTMDEQPMPPAPPDPPDWDEAAGDDLIMARELGKEAEMDTGDILARLTALRDRQLAGELDIPPETVEMLREKLMQAREQKKSRSEFGMELFRQEAEIQKEQPDFDLTDTIDKSPAFRALILAGEPVERALSYIDPDREARRVEREIVARIRRRNTRPQPMGAANGRMERVDVAHMSEAQLRQIDERLKRGERVRI